MHEPDLAIIAANPTVFKQMVLPPVLGPVITKTRVLWFTKKSTGTGWACSSAVTWKPEMHLSWKNIIIIWDVH